MKLKPCLGGYPNINRFQSGQNEKAPWSMAHGSSSSYVTDRKQEDLTYDVCRRACGLSNDILDLVPDRLEPVLGGQKIGKKISYLLRAYLLRVERLLRDHLSVLHVSSYTQFKVAFFKLRQHRIVKPTQF